jgi:hypothetical protein
VLHSPDSPSILGHSSQERLLLVTVHTSANEGAR